jgi:diguanylate cyclase (GGDEF)-like protein
MVACWGDGQFKPDFATEACWAMRRGKTWKATGSRLLECEHGSPERPHVCVPVVGQGEALGVIHLRLGEEEDSERAEAVCELGERLADVVGPSLANLRLRDRLRAMSMRDPLTDLYNRRHMEDSLEREISRAERKEAPLSLAMLDLDNFKDFNDQHGHSAGDKVLAEVAEVLRNAVRQGDIVSRYGGEEFVVVLPETRLEIAEKRARQIRRQIGQLSIRHDGECLPTVTATIGVAAYPEDAQSPEGLLEAADAALYRGKDAGRDRVCVAADVETNGL